MSSNVKPALYFVQGTKNLASWLITPPSGFHGTPLWYGTHGIKEILDSTHQKAAGVAKLVDYFDVDYPAAAIDASGSVATGVLNLTNMIKARPGPFFLCGVSQGAEVISQVYKKILVPGGELYDRNADLLNGFAFGNPLREQGHNFPGGPDPGGHGIGTIDVRLSGSETRWWEFAAVETSLGITDIIAICGDDVTGSLAQSIFAWVFDDYDGVMSEMNAAAIAFFSESPAVLVNDLVNSIRELFFWIDAHLSYVTWKPIVGDDRGSVQIAVDQMLQVAQDLIPPRPTRTPEPGLGYSAFADDRFRYICEEAVTGKILSRDLIVQKAKVLRALSGACNIQFDINYRDYENAGIYFKPYGHWIHVEKMIFGERKIWASALVTPSQIDKKTGIMHIVAQGFAAYPKKMPWLDNWNPLAVDPFEIVQRIWTSLQSYPNGNLGVTVYPVSSGLEMLPGYAFDGQLLNQNFYAIFIRAVDKVDSGDYIDKLARDIPFDYVEQSAWNDDRSAIEKKLFLGYPIAGALQDNLAFVVNENVIETSPHIETEIDWASDVIVDGWAPATEYSSQLTNADPLRYRRVITEDDARINSDERAAAWAKRKLTRRQTPAHWDSIIVDMGHPNAPFGSYDVGDRIFVKGLMPWLGDLNQIHKILAIGVDEDSGTCELTLRAEGAYEYDPIFYQGSVSGSVTVTVPDMPVMNLSADAPTIG